jgi:protein-disulfide isomerase
VVLEDGRQQWPTGWALLVMPIVVLLSFLALTPPRAQGDLQEGGSVASLQRDLAEKLRTAEAYKNYFETQFKRYDNRWQHTYTAWLISPPVQISMENARVRGPSTAAHTLTVYSDFQCPTCKKFEETVSSRIVPLAGGHGGMRVVFKHFPLSPSCNYTARNDTHPVACEAAMAAEAALVLGGNDAFWKMHDLLFAFQDEWKRSKEDLEKGKKPNFDKYAQQIGLNLDAFHKAMASEQVMQRIKADVAEGATLGQNLASQGLITPEEQALVKVDSTPTIFIDNKRLASAQHFKTWQKILSEPTPPWRPEPRRPAATAPTNAALRAPAAGAAAYERLVNRTLAPATQPGATTQPR